MCTAAPRLGEDPSGDTVWNISIFSPHIHLYVLYIHIYIHAFIQIFKTYIHICAHTLNIKIREPVLWIIDSGSSMNLIFIRSCFFDSGTDDAVVVVVGGGSVFAEGNGIRIGFVFAFAAAYVDWSLRQPIFKRRILYKFVCMHIYMYVCMFVCMYLYIYVYIIYICACM